MDTELSTKSHLMFYYIMIGLLYNVLCSCAYREWCQLSLARKVVVPFVQYLQGKLTVMIEVTSTWLAIISNCDGLRNCDSRIISLIMQETIAYCNKGN